ncbi:MAG: 3-hydroxyacyl-CoA dehydrogenase family protein [Rhizobiaceae bacterium]|nr:3-hydroxyacyl-CoA dehydrogenase family protein [Rhizobiaceae bacterium]
MAEAQALGIVDRIVDVDLLAAAIDHARSMADAPPAGPSHMATGGQVGDCVPPPLTPPHKGEGDLTTAFPDKNGDDLRSKRLQAGSPPPCGEGSGVGVASNASAMPARRGRGGPKGRSGGSPSPYAIPHVAIRRAGGLAVQPFDADAVEAQIAAIERKARGQISPGRAARMVRQAADLPFAEGLARERAAFLDLLASDQAGALRHVFAAERLAGKVPGLDGVEPAPIRTVGVVGAGLMGAGIAACFADAGYAVRVVERDGAAMQAGRGRIVALYERQIQSGRIDRTTADTRLTRLSFGAERAGLADCDLVVEAVFDELAVKQELFAALSGIVRPDALLATNTSYLDPDAIASVVANPERVLGLHFFSPANVMRLVEVVRAAQTAPRALATGLAIAKRLGKLGIVSGVCEGFVGNRIFTAYRRACDFMLEDGALPHEIDAALEGWGFAMGPYAVNDLAGLDISWARRKRQAATRDPAERYVSIADRLCEAGRLGRKSGKGYYAYEDGRRTVDPIVTDIVEAASREKGIVRRSIPAEEIVGRVLATMADEGKKILDEGIALRASDIDLVLINGYGFPAWRGGPMYLAGHR